jgi:2-iminobutanoate/2-iminopropanoate deaminase
MSSVISSTRTVANLIVNYKTKLMKKHIIQTENAPAPIGPYSQAVRFGDLLFTSGQIAIDPATGELITGDIKEETRQVMRNLEAVLEAAGADFSQVVKTSIFVADMGDFTAINEVYANYFDEQNAPARETVEVANLPKYVGVEISMIVGLG